MQSAAVALLLVLANGQAQPPRFRTGVDVVELDVTILDRDRRPVRGLTAAHFMILEAAAGACRVEEIDLPEPDSTAAAWMRDVAPDVRR